MVLVSHSDITGVDFERIMILIGWAVGGNWCWVLILILFHVGDLA